MAINYWCPNFEKRSQCEYCNSKGDFQLDEKDENLHCPHNEEIKIKVMGESASMVFTKEKMTPQQVQKERKARSSEHFKKEILPTLGVAEKIHFSQKFGKKK